MLLDAVATYSGAGSVSSLIGTFQEIFGSILSFITGNWVLSLFLVIPIGVGLLSAILSLFNRN